MRLGCPVCKYKIVQEMSAWRLIQITLTIDALTLFDTGSERQSEHHRAPHVRPTRLGTWVPFPIKIPAKVCW